MRDPEYLLKVDLLFLLIIRLNKNKLLRRKMQGRVFGIDRHALYYLISKTIRVPVPDRLVPGRPGSDPVLRAGPEAEGA